MFVAGLPGAGKSLVVGQTAALAREAGRAVHLLQWDVARLAFDTPEVLARYPEVGGITHAAIRIAVGIWVRGAVLRWHHDHPDARDLLIGETPLVGERLMELARPRADDLEPLLAGPDAVFVVPVPSPEVRRVIEAARARDMAGPGDAKSAPPELVRAHWDEIERAGVALGGDPPRSPGRYDADVYAAAYRRLLRHRRTVVLPLTRILRVGTSAHALPAWATEIVPLPDDVARAMAEVERLAPAEVERRAADWYRA